MKIPVIFRKRHIPNEMIELKDDILLYRDDSMLITQWNTLKPRSDIAGGLSLYLMDKGCKISRIHDAFGKLLHYYCDIIHTDYYAENGTNVADGISIYWDNKDKIFKKAEIDPSQL